MQTRIDPRRPTPRAPALCFAIAAFTLAGCGASQRTTPAENTSPTRVELDEPTERVGPEPTTPAHAEAPAHADSATPRPAQPSTTPSGAAWRRDGRPTWWLSEPVRSEGRVSLAAEAIADDVLAARRAAVDAGRTALARETGKAVVEERIEAVTVRRLGADRPGGERYVGYVLISARAGG